MKIIKFHKQTNLLPLSIRLASTNLSKTSSYFSRWLPKYLEKMMTSSRYTSKVCHCNPRSTASMSRLKLAGSKVIPKGCIFHCHNPDFVTKAYFSLSSIDGGNCQQLEIRSDQIRRSSVLNHLLPTSASKLSSTHGIGYASCIMLNQCNASNIVIICAIKDMLMFTQK